MTDTSTARSGLRPIHLVWFAALAFPFALGLLLWTIYSDYDRYNASRVQSGYVAEAVDAKKLTLRLGDARYPLELANTKGLQKPKPGQTFFVVLTESRPLRVCAMSGTPECYEVASSSGADLRARMQTAPTAGELERQKKQALEANKFES